MNNKQVEQPQAKTGKANNRKKRRKNIVPKRSYFLITDIDTTATVKLAGLKATLKR